MALVTANQFRLTPDVAGMLGQGIQVGQQLKSVMNQPRIEQLTKMALQGNVESMNELAALSPAGAQNVQSLQANRFNMGQKVSERRAKSVAEGALEVQAIQDPNKKLEFLRSRLANLPTQGADNTDDTQELISMYESGDVEGANALVNSVVELSTRKGILKARPEQANDQQFTLGAGQKRFNSAGEEVASVAPKKLKSDATSEQAIIPPVLLSGLPLNVAEKGSAAFTAAGGGKDGLKAFQEIVDSGSEQEKRIASPKILQSSFPKASPAEMVQLQATMDSANSTQEGLKLASKLRVEQRRDLKGKDFQIKAIELLDGILGNDQISDVLGSVEGAIDFRLFSDAESELISDIEEAKNILTADNLSLMSGVLSESDIKILANLSGGALNRKRTEKRFINDVTSLRDRLKAKMIVTADDTANDRSNSIALPPSGREGGVLQIDAAGNRAFVFDDGTFEEI
jgi:hypothetical protein